MTGAKNNPRVLIVTPEIAYVPTGMGHQGQFSAKAGGLADVSAALISALFEQGADVHIAIPDYRALFNGKLPQLIENQRKTIRKKMPHERVHLAEDRAFFYLDSVYSGHGLENLKISIAFQREVINNIIPLVQPDLIHCNDWMTGLIPAMARQMEIPCLFTIHNIHTIKCTLADIEDRGIDAAAFWNFLYYEQMASNYEATRNHIPVDFLTSGIFASHFVNTVSPTFLQEIVDGQHNFILPFLQQEISNKWHAGCAFGILNAPDPSFNPNKEKSSFHTYDPENYEEGKKKNKRLIQKTFNLVQDDQAPLFFWPSRLDPVQKGCQLLADILYEVISKYWYQKLQVIFVANGEYQKYFKEIVHLHRFHKRVVICDFDRHLERLAYGASDFILMPSSFEPCGLPQMIGPIYGTLPVAHDTGGIHDTISDLNLDNHSGNGFLFKTFDANGLKWAIDQAMMFFTLDPKIKNPHIKRIMEESTSTFNHAVTARKYIDLYEIMLKRPLIN